MPLFYVKIRKNIDICNYLPIYYPAICRGWGTFSVPSFMGCCKLAQVDVRKWLSHFFTHIHEYDNDYSRDLMELLPHNLKQKGTL